MIICDFICSKCIEINWKLRKCYLDKGFRVNICSGRIVMCKIGILDKIQDGFIYVCALFALTVNKVVDYVVDAFKRAYKEGRL